MPDKLRFKVAVPDSPTAPLNDETVWIDFEPAFMDENLRRLVRSRINLEVTIMRDLMGDEQFSEGLSRGGSIPSNYWAPEPMDVCKGEYNREAAGVMPKGHYESNGEWIPDHTIASAPTMDALLDALLDDDDRVCNEILNASDPNDSAAE